MDAIPDNEFKLLQRSIHNQRYQMELALETMPREVYSNQLMEAMRREEMAVRDGVKITRESVAAIDEMLRSETSKFYRKIWKENEKRWQNLQTKVDNEYSRFFQSGSRQGSRQGSRAEKNNRSNAITSTSTSGATASSTLSGTSVSNKSTGTGTATASASASAKTSGSKPPTEEDLDAEVNRLEQDYNANWHKYESENLATAFRSQLDRVESEWSQHEQNLTEDYNRKKITEKIGHNRIKEKTSSSSSSSAGGGGSNNSNSVQLVVIVFRS